MMKALMEAGHGFRDCAFDAINIRYKKIFSPKNFLRRNVSYRKKFIDFFLNLKPIISGQVKFKSLKLEFQNSKGLCRKRHRHARSLHIIQTLCV